MLKLLAEPIVSKYELSKSSKMEIFPKNIFRLNKLLSYKIWIFQNEFKF